MKTLQEATHLGLDFINTNGVRVRSYQLLNDKGYAVATADFDGPTCTRFLFADSVADSARVWFAHVQTLVV